METQVQLNVATGKDRYSLGEDIVVRVYLFNFGDDPIIVNSRFAPNRSDSPGEVAFEVIGPSGKELPFVTRVDVGEPEAEDFSTVQPWSCVGKQYELQSYFNVNKAGQYTVAASYKNEWSGEHLGLNAWTGSLRSNTAQFQVEK